MRISEILNEHGDKWERDSEGKGIGWGFTEWEDEARKYKDQPRRAGTGLGNEPLTPDQAAKMHGDSLRSAFDDEEEELEERKVTKTLAGRVQKPSEKLAMDLKKKSPNQGKPAVEIEKSAKSVKNLSDEMVKGEYSTGKLASQKRD